METTLAKILLALTTALALCWILLDASVWPFDPAYYGEVTLQLYYTLLHHPSELWQAMVSAFGFKAPGIAWLGILFVPLARLTGSIESALLLLVLFSGLLAIWLLFLSLRHVSGGARFAALSGALHAITAPLFIGLLYNYFTEQLQLLAVCIVIWSVCVPRPKHLMVACGTIGLSLGMLAKASTPLYILAPGVIGVWRLFSRPSESSSSNGLRAPCFWALAVLLALGASAWYIHNWQAIKTFIASTSSGSVAELYGHSGAFSEKLWKWLDWARGAFFIGKAPALFWLGALLCALVLRIRRKESVTLFDTFTFLSIIQLSTVLSVFSLQVNEETRYLLPALPYLAFITAFIAKEVSKWLPGVIIASGLVQFAVVHGAALGAALPTPLIHTPWLKPLEQSAEKKQMLAEAVVHSCSEKTRNHYVIIGLELPEFNANSAAFYSAQQLLTNNYRCFYTSLGYAESDAARAMKRLTDMQPEAVIYLRSYKPKPSPDPFNAVSQEVRAQLATVPQYKLETIENFPDLEYYDRVE